MRLRLTKLDEFQFLTCFKHQVWGRNSARFKDWQIGDYLVFIVDKAIAGLAEVAGKPYVSKQALWDKGAYPHRLPMKFVQVMLPENRPPMLGEIRDALTSTSVWGPKYGWGIVNQMLLEGDSAETIVKAIRTRPNDITKVQSELDQYLDSARVQQMDAVVLPKRPRGRPKKIEIDSSPKPEPIGSKVEESAHSRAQHALIRLGKTTGCAVWIAANDRNRQYKGQNLGDGCVKALPNLGMNKEATGRIALIDVIWIRQNAPMGAFEVETTTSIYSGLLRMSDLLSVVPALNMKLFIVAPRERQDRVMSELSRPTFQKIGLSEYCRFIATEDLGALFEKVEGLTGHIQPSIMDTIAIELADESEDAVEAG